jgi:OmpA-OmpF porin, OOP family
MMKKIAMAVLLAAFVATPVVAAESYVGVSVGQNDIDLNGIDKSTAFSIFGGLAFNEFFAAELAYVDMGSADTIIPGYSIDGRAISLAAVGSLPLTPDFSLFAKLGYASTKLEATGGASETHGDYTYGVGAQFDVSKEVGIRVAYDNYKVFKDPSEDSALTSIGVLFKF